MTSDVSLWASIPFLLMLLSIAVMPFIHRHWWEKNYPFVSFFLGLLMVLLYFFLFKGYDRLVKTGLEYFSFIVLIGSLFVVAGGILIRIKGATTPWMNAVVLLVGAVISNVIGTTGASVLLIRPFLRLNKARFSGYLVVFFIFIVSNVGGALTPIGDPPLFLGYLVGVPFFWLLGRVWHIWLLVVLVLVAIFLFFDFRNRRGLDEPAFEEGRGVRFMGWYNLLFLLAILVAVFLDTPWRELLMLAAAAGSYISTPRAIHADNAFDFHPIKEVALLFLGIFATMMPTLDYLESHASSLGLSAPGTYYWATGSLSAFLDNAPTYLAFLSAAMGFTGSDVAGMLHSSPLLIVAISLGAVFFGAANYIGNGPNFIVRSIVSRPSLVT
ncbi:MAG: sodium:proton antiporter [Coprothermobacterota bacterium]|nr:sodium:proton antiporter [Coprothermobacterota bacterium]